MELFRIHAYAVEPQRTSETQFAPDGGALQITADLRAALRDNVSQANFETRTPIDFQVDTETRTNEIRDWIIDYAFSDSSKADCAATDLAWHLSLSMDRRSDPALFIVAAMRDGDRRELTLWIFPRDSAYQFHTGADGPLITVLTDIFSQTSGLRKAAKFAGRNLRNEFVSGRVLDFQTDAVPRRVADFWIIRFLQCGLGIRGDSGTRLLTSTLRTAHEQCKDADDRDQIYVAIMALPRIQRTRWSMQAIANHFFQGRAREAFLNAVPNRESLTASFDLQRPIYEKNLRIRVFHLDTGVHVSSPLAEMGQSVIVGESAHNRITCTGNIIQEKMRSRHG